MVSVVVTYYVLPGKKEEYLVILKELIKHTQAEEGCVYYDLYENVEGFDTDNAFTLVEVWKDQAALDFHLEQDYFLSSVEKLTPIRKTERIRNVYKKAY